MTFRTDPLISALIRFRYAVLAVTVCITVVFAYFITKIRIDNDPTHTIPSTLPAMADYNRLQAIFPSPRTILLIAQFDRLPLMAKIDSISAWARRFEDIEGIGNVVHIGSVQVPVRGGFFGITSDYLVSRDKKITEEEIRARARDSRSLTGMLISPDETTLSMMMDVDESYDQIEVVSQVDRVRSEIARQAPARIYITGGALYTYHIDKTMRRDFSVLLPLCLVVVFGLLFLVYRRLSYVVISLLITAVALVWTFGLMGMLRMPFSVVSSIIPIILFPIGVATAIHVLSTHARIAVALGDDNLAAIKATFCELMNPIFLSAITTFAGFASFSFSYVKWTRVFGIFASIGVALALLLSLALLPVFLSFQKRTAVFRTMHKTDAMRWAPLWNAYRNFIGSRFQWAVLAALIFAAGVIGFSRVRVEGNPIAMFSPQSDIRKTDALIEKHLGGTRFLFVVLEKVNGTIESVEDWRRIREIARYAESSDMVGGAFSLVPLIEKISAMFGDSAISGAAVSMLLKSGGLMGKKLDSYVRAWLTPDRRKAKIALICKNVEGTRFIEFSRRLQAHIAGQYPEFKSLVAGPPALNNAMTFMLIDTQKQSLILAFAFVFAMLCLLFRSLKTGLFAIIPIMFSTLFVYALMGFFGVAINSVTVVIVNTCIGIGIDYAIHFVAGYLYIRPQHDNDAAALEATAKAKGSVIMFNTFVVGIGFLALAFSSFPPIRDLGVFVCVSMAASAGFSMAFLPVLFWRFGYSGGAARKPA